MTIIYIHLSCNVYKYIIMCKIKEKFNISIYVICYCNVCLSTITMGLCLGWPHPLLRLVTPTVLWPLIELLIFGWEVWIWTSDVVTWLGCDVGRVWGVERGGCEMSGGWVERVVWGGWTWWWVEGAECEDVRCVWWGGSTDGALGILFSSSSPLDCSPEPQVGGAKSSWSPLPSLCLNIDMASILRAQTPLMNACFMFCSYTVISALSCRISW